MAKDDTRVEDFVRDELQKNPHATTAELFERAKKLDRNIGKLSIRQFHARYPLQVKRRAAALRPRRRRRARSKPADRSAIRTELLGFARALLAADGAGMVDVLGAVDKYVERVIAAAGGAAAA